MGNYLLLFVSLLCMVVYFSVMKVYQKRIKATMFSACLFMSIAGLVASVICMFLMDFNFSFTGFSIIMGLALATAESISNVLGIKILSVGGISIFTMFLMLGGMIMPFLYGITFLGEPTTIMNLIALPLMILSLYLISRAENEEKSKNKRLLITLLIMIFFSNGATSVVTKAHQINTQAVSVYQFVFLEFTFIFLICSILTISLYFKNKEENRAIFKQMVCSKTVILPVLYTVFFLGTTMCLVTCAQFLPASVQYPVVTGGSAVLSTIVGRVIFKDKTTKLAWTGVIIAFIATVLFGI